MSYDPQGFVELVWVLRQAPFLIADQGSAARRLAVNAKARRSPGVPRYAAHLDTLMMSLQWSCSSMHRQSPQLNRKTGSRENEQGLDH